MSANKLGEDSIPAVEEKKKAKSVVREYVEAIGMALLLALFIRTLIVQAFKIPSGSMIPTLQIGDHILVNKLAYGIRIPFWEHYFIKRVIAVGGDVVEIRGKKIYVNNVLQDDPHAHFEREGEQVPELPVRDDYGPTKVPDHHIFVMGDNRDRSYDSRFWGFVDLEDVKGKAFLIYWSWDGSDRWVRWERTGELIY